MEIEDEGVQEMISKEKAQKLLKDAQFMKEPKKNEWIRCNHCDDNTVSKYGEYYKCSKCGIEIHESWIK